MLIDRQPLKSNTLPAMSEAVSSAESSCVFTSLNKGLSLGECDSFINLFACYPQTSSFIINHRINSGTIKSTVTMYNTCMCTIIVVKLQDDDTKLTDGLCCKISYISRSHHIHSSH